MACGTGGSQIPAALDRLAARREGFCMRTRSSQGGGKDGEGAGEAGGVQVARQLNGVAGGGDGVVVAPERP